MDDEESFSTSDSPFGAPRVEVRPVVPGREELVAAWGCEERGLLRALGSVVGENPGSAPEPGLVRVDREERVVFDDCEVWASLGSDVVCDGEDGDCCATDDVLEERVSFAGDGLTETPHDFPDNSVDCAGLPFDVVAKADVGELDESVAGVLGSVRNPWDCDDFGRPVQRWLEDVTVVRCFRTSGG